MTMWRIRNIGTCVALSAACASAGTPMAAPAPHTIVPVTTCRDSTPQQREAGEEWPETVAQAVERIIEKLSPEDRETLRSTPRDDLVRFHHGWGTGIRNGLGLWRGNDALLADCGCVDPDGCSMQIIYAVWERLQSEGRGRTP